MRALAEGSLSGGNVARGEEGRENSDELACMLRGKVDFSKSVILQPSEQYAAPSGCRSVSQPRQGW